MKSKLKIGLFGLGHLGKIHLKCLLELSGSVEIIGFFEPNDQVSNEIKNNFNLRRVQSEIELLDISDAVIIASPTKTHFEICKLAIDSDKHFFVEKPMTSSLEEAEILLKSIEKKNLKAQVGFVERFNPAFQAISEFPLNPRFIEAHRLANFNPRGTDVSVVLDLMIHDLDILLKLVPFPVKSVSANGVAIISKTPDIANARIEFSNGTVANITSSRISLKNMRKFRLFQEDAYISMDFLEKKSEIIRLSSENSDSKDLIELGFSTDKKFLEIISPKVEPVNAIKRELELFITAIINNSETVVPLSEGFKALELANRIMEEIKINLNNINHENL